jgi:hypothetical protein
MYTTKTYTCDMAYLGYTDGLCRLHGYFKRGDVSVSNTRRILEYTILVCFLLTKCVSACLVRIVSDTRTSTRVT